MSLSPGARLGPYEILSPLGSGGMGEVYLAKDTRLGREVAIKVLPAEVASDPDRLARFEREAKAVSALNHPHIVTLYEVGTSEAGPYLVLEKIDGRSLRELLSDAPLPVRRILTLGAQIAEGVAKAHSAGIVHRDLKPENIMVTGDGHAKVLDFGLAKLVWPELGAAPIEETTLVKDTASGVILGTLGYLSPEQASGKPADYRADQFALGALLYEMATRERPFKRATVLESLTATIRDEPEPVRSKRADLPAPFEWLIERCLAKDPNDRYASTSDLARELGSLRDHLSDLTKLAPADAASRPVRVLPRGLLGWAAALAVLAAVGAGGFFVARQTAAVSGGPSYQPLTFQRGLITGARFGRDGKTVYYSASYGAEPSRIFVTHIERIDSKLLDVPPGFLLAVSAKDELAVLLTNQRATYAAPGILARLPSVGGTPRHLVENANYADWAPDGERLVIVRGGNQCEFPIGRLLTGPCTQPRISPTSDRMALTRPGRLEIADLDGKRLVGDDMPFVFGLAWAPDGKELWFTGSETGSAHDRALYALSLTGVRRLIARTPGPVTIYDVSPDGRSALITTGAGWFGVNASTLGSNREQSLDLLGRSTIMGLSSNGKLLLIDEAREVGTGAYLRSTDGATTVPLSKHLARGLSPDGTLALVQPRGDPGRLTLVPTGAGAERDVPLPGLEVSQLEPARWSRDGRRLFMWLRAAGGNQRTARLHVRDGDRPWQAITPAGVPTPFAVSPDGQHVAVSEDAGSIAIFSTDGQPPRRLEGELGRPIHWSTDGRHLFLIAPELYPARVYRRDLVSGRVEPWRTIAPADPTGVLLIGGVLIADDERSFVYQYSRGLNDLFLARGLR